MQTPVKAVFFKLLDPLCEVLLHQISSICQVSFQELWRIASIRS